MSTKKKQLKLESKWPRMRKLFFMFIAPLFAAVVSVAGMKQKTHFSYNFLMDIGCMSEHWHGDDDDGAKHVAETLREAF
jgi:hypothetical protein